VDIFRAFSLIEAMAVTAIVGVAASLGIAVSARTSHSIDDSPRQFSILDFVQQERNAHVNRGMATGVLVLCTATDGGPCAAGGNELVVYPAQACAMRRSTSSHSFPGAEDS
jgi:prepilin-type N-terminal cleavage/methylation domain-containing protein